MIPFKAKKSDIKPITAKTLEEMARKFSSLSVRMPFTSSFITPIIAGIESTANNISVEPITSKARKILVKWAFPFILVKKRDECMSGSMGNNLEAPFYRMFDLGFTFSSSFEKAILYAVQIKMNPKT